MSFMNIGRVHGSAAPIAITETTRATAPSAYPAPARQCSRPSPSSVHPRPRARTRINRPTAAAGTVAILAHGVVKCAIRLVSVRMTTTMPMSA